MGRGAPFAYRDPGEIWEEIRRVWPAGRGITYARLESGGLQWPCPAEDHPGTTLLHAGTFARGPRAPLSRIAWRPTPETVTPEFPFLLTTGRTLHQFNAGTMTMRTDNVRLRPADTLDLNPADAGRLGFTPGQRLAVRSRHGATVLPLRCDPRVKPGEAFATFHTAVAALNRLIGPGTDNVTQTPEYKVTAVALSPAG
jgi:formate dehydrogenase major subunit